MKRLFLPAIAVLALCACSSATASGTAPAHVSCKSIQPWMMPVVTDQQSQDSRQQQNWVDPVLSETANYLTSQGQDLQNAINVAENVSGSTTLEADIESFTAGAMSFLSNENEGLEPGWQTYYDPLRSEIFAIAELCGYP
jgi:hypothetical protein